MSPHTPTALVISSFVAASRVGASASAFCLRRLGVKTLVLPTVLLGRHPGWGTPGGGAVDIDILRGMWEGIKAQNLNIDGVLTGYMASPEQAALTAEIISYVREQNPEAIIVVDPVMGDDGRLYVPEPTAKAIREQLVPLADICTPNLWELGYLAGEDIDDVQDALPAARALPCDVLITSVPFTRQSGAAQIGAALVLQKKAGQDPQPSYGAAHEKFKTVPHGGGDALAGTFLARRLGGMNAKDSFAQSVASLFEIISAASDIDAEKMDNGEMPLIRAQDALITAAPLPLKIISE